MQTNNSPYPTAINEIRRCHSVLRVIKQLLKQGEPTKAYVEVSQALIEAPDAFR